MPLTLVTGPANSAKAGAVLGGVRAALDREPLLVVPTRADVDHYRRELAEDRLVVGVRVVPFDGVLREVARRAGVSGRPLGELARERVVASVCARAGLRALGASAATPGFPRAAARLFGELEVARVEPPRLAAGLRTWAGEDAGRRAYGEEVARLYGSYRAALDRLGRPDAELWALEALDALRRAPASWGATPVFFYGFDDLTPLQLDAVEALARRVDADVWLSLTFEPGRMAFAGRAATYAALSGWARRVELPAVETYYADGSRTALHALERRLFEDAAGEAVDPGEAVAVLEAGGERAEAELVGAEVLALLRGGVPAEQVAVVVRSVDEAGPLFERVLGEMGVPVAARRRVALGRTAVGRGLLALLRCVAPGAAARDVVAALRAPGVLRRPEAADGLERFVRRGGAADAAGALGWWQERRGPLGPIERVRAAAAEGTPALCAALAAEALRMTRGLGDAGAAAPPASEAGAAAPPASETASRAAGVAPPASEAAPPAGPLLDSGARAEAAAAAAAVRALGELGELAAEAPPLAPDPAELAAALDGLPVLVGDPPAPGRVTVADPLALRARRVRALVLAGLQEGAFPRPASPEAFLSDAERRELAVASGIVLPRHEDALGAERFLFYATVSRPQERLVLAFRTATDDGDPAVPSFFLDDVREVFGAALWERRTHRTLGAIAWPGGAPTPAAAARARAAAAPPRPVRPVAPLGGAAAAALRDRPAWSASALEAWAACPVKWFVERYLHADDLEPESEPLVRGSIAHETLERTLRGLAEDTGSARVTPDRLPAVRERLTEVLAEVAERTRLSPSPERLAAGVRRLRADLERYLEAAAHDGSVFEPARFETGFGFDEDPESLPGLEVQAPDGPVLLRGRIDRIDVEPGGRRAVVIDYKSGRSVYPGARWEEDGVFQAAVYLRAAQELLGLEPAGAFYQPLGGADGRRRGLMVDDADPDLDVVGDDRQPEAEVRARLDRVIDLAAHAAAEARSGALEPRPDTCTPWKACAYPGICRCEAA